MQPSSTLCRTQEAYHHALARAATLDNVRMVSRAAAAAWAREGVAASLREDRKLRARAFAGAHSVPGGPLPDDICWPNDNPEREHADAG